VKWTLAFLLLAHNITGIHFTGNSSRLPGTLERAAGLRTGMVASKESLDRACERLTNTGFISMCKYKWTDSAKGSEVTFEIEELPSTETVRFNVPGVNEETLWTWIQQNDPMLTRRAPDSERATRSYVAALKRYRPELPEPAVNMDLGTHTITIGQPPPPDPSRARTADVKEEKQDYLMGKLNVEGLPSFSTNRVKGMWKIAEGEKFTRTQVDDFVDAVFKSGILPIEIQNANPSVEVRPDTRTADVTIRFKGAL